MKDDATARAARHRYAIGLTGLSQRQLAKRLRVSGQAVSKWVSGKSEPSRKNARELAELAGVSLEWLLNGRDGNGGDAIVRSNVAVYSGRGRAVPEVGDTVQGVLPVSKRKAGAFVHARYPCSSDSQALAVSGDSMAPRFLDGDVVVIDPKVAPEPGDFVFVAIGKTNLFRRYRPKLEDGFFDLVPLNPDWPTVSVAPKDRAVIKGVMMEHTSPRRRTG